MVWAKNRSSALNYHEVQDAARGAAKTLWTNLASAQTDYSGGSYSLRSFDSNGFTVVDDGAGSYGINGPNGGNYSGNGTYVAWAWAASSVTPSSEGSITPTAQYVNSTTKFSISAYTSPNNASNQTVGHGLGVKPDFMIVKNMSSAYNWDIYSAALGFNASLIFTTAHTRSDGFGAEPDADVFTTENTYTHNGTDKYVAYCFANTEGYCRAGKFIGNGTSNYINVGFYPRWILIKRSVANSSPDTSTDYSSWAIVDTKRYTYNGLTPNWIWANKPQGEGYRGNGSSTSSLGDMAVWPMSNGFYMSGPASSVNASTGEYVYLAIAEAPFSLARPR